MYYKILIGIWLLCLVYCGVQAYNQITKSHVCKYYRISEYYIRFVAMMYMMLLILVILMSMKNDQLINSLK